ncbi:MAG TPA: carboxylating nicotinate-nucleotide diphosphorylase [Firmicutes bacterium]|nr:carboxylating nicotinate-nucleotide diphosphorylase [Bacillota bacterium]
MKASNVTMKLHWDAVILAALKEDIPWEDVSANAVVPEDARGHADLIAKADGVVAGLPVFCRTFELLDEDVQIDLHVQEGERVTAGTLLAEVTGNLRALLSGERTALNFLQRMSGIATYTRQMAQLLEGTGTTLLDTRKTTPLLRSLEKYAVSVGGGSNHRFNLSDGVLLKDNHIGAAGGVRQAIGLARAYAPFVRRIEIEVETLEQLDEALDAGADIVMLDNMKGEALEEAVRRARGRAETEISGNVTRENLERYVALGVNYISSGALTHSAPILDVSLKHMKRI